MVTAEKPGSRASHITLDRKRAGKPIAGNRHDGFEGAGAGTQLTVRLMRHSQRKRGATDRLNLRSMALALDPTNTPRIDAKSLIACHISWYISNRRLYATYRKAFQEWPKPSRALALRIPIRG